jgi:Protein of unknown function (DUF3604)
MALRRVLPLVLIVLPAIAAVWAYLAVTGYLGEPQGIGAIASQSRESGLVANDQQRQREAREKLPVAEQNAVPEKQILFGDLHVHTTYSFDAYNLSLPMYQGEGEHPPGDACDFARYCSALDFWSINDHAEGLTPQLWAQTKEMVRQCNAVAGDSTNPDMVTFLGWEWTQSGPNEQKHFGHKNVVLRDTEESEVPARPIAAQQWEVRPKINAYIMKFRLLLIAGVEDGDARRLYHNFIRFLQGGDEFSAVLDGDVRQRYYNFIRFLRNQDKLVPCERGKSVRELPADCQESALTPTELFAKLDDWDFPYLTVPHGSAWGFYTPPLSSWSKQLAAHSDPERHEPLIEIFSGHGNSEYYRPWRAVAVDEMGHSYCPEPTTDFLPECWQAGEIIRARCLTAGESIAECERRAAGTRANFILAEESGHWTVPGSIPEDWLDAGQCRDCFMPVYNLRPTGSVQYGLAIRDFTDETLPPKRFRWGIIGSSDSHTARAGNGYKEIMRYKTTDVGVENTGSSAFLIEQEPLPNFVTLEQTGGLRGPFFERHSSFLGTGGLVAVHARGRDRQAIWDALQRKEVYATSGDRILLWFDLIDTHPGKHLPMGSSVRSTTVPEFKVSAMGAFEQKPGCPADSLRALPADRLQRLCGSECYNPGDRRKRIDRIEVVRIRPQIVAGEDVGSLIEDPWRVLPCPADGDNCTVRFSDPDFVSAGRDAVYYVRALQDATAMINGANLRCERDATGQCTAVNPCRAVPPTAYTDDCLADAQERAWSSPIFVDYGMPLQN